MTPRSECDRRAHHSVLHVPELRSGFDRRRPAPVLGMLRDNAAMLCALIGGIVLMSLLDWLLTMRALEYGASEGNPVMARLIAIDPGVAAGFKLATTLLVAWMMWRNRRYRAVLATSLAAFGLYVTVIAYHLGGLAGLGAI